MSLSDEARQELERIVPPNLQSGLLLYFDKGIRPGRYLSALLANDLFEACRYADMVSARRMALVGLWVATHAPGHSVGSWEAVRDWCESFGEAA